MLTYYFIGYFASCLFVFLSQPEVMVQKYGWLTLFIIGLLWFVIIPYAVGRALYEIFSNNDDDMGGAT